MCWVIQFLHTLQKNAPQLTPSHNSTLNATQARSSSWKHRRKRYSRTAPGPLPPDSRRRRCGAHRAGSRGRALPLPYCTPRSGRRPAPPSHTKARPARRHFQLPRFRVQRRKKDGPSPRCMPGVEVFSRLPAVRQPRDRTPYPMGQRGGALLPPISSRGEVLFSPGAVCKRCACAARRWQLPADSAPWGGCGRRCWYWPWPGLRWLWPSSTRPCPCSSRSWTSSARAWRGAALRRGSGQSSTPRSAVSRQAAVSPGLRAALRARGGAERWGEAAGRPAAVRGLPAMRGLLVLGCVCTGPRVPVRKLRVR